LRKELYRIKWSVFYKGQSLKKYERQQMQQQDRFQFEFVVCKRPDVNINRGVEKQKRSCKKGAAKDSDVGGSAQE